MRVLASLAVITATVVLSQARPQSEASSEEVPVESSSEEKPVEILPNGCPVSWDVHMLLPHENDCSLFYYCVRGEKVLRQCTPATHFNPIKQVCDWPENAGCANQGTSSESSVSKETSEQSAESSESSDSDVLPNGCPTDFEIHQLLPHENRCNKFYYCVFGEKVLRECAPGTHFNPELQVCDWPQNVNCVHSNEDVSDTDEDSSAGGSSEDNNVTLENGCPSDWDIHRLLPHESECNLFYYCVHGETVLRECAPGTHFNPNLEVCDWPENAGCKNGNGGNSGGNSDSSSHESSNSHSHENSGSHSHESSGGQSHESSGSHSHESSGSHSHENSGSHSHENSGSHSHESSGGHSQESSGSHSHENSGSHSHENSGSHSHENSGSHSHENPGSHSHENSGSHSHENSGSHSHENPGSHSHENSGSHSHENSGGHSHESSGSQSHESSPEWLENGCPADWDVHHLLPHETRCNLFYYCVHGNKVERECPPGLHYNNKSNVCDWPQNAGCTNAGGSDSSSSENSDSSSSENSGNGSNEWLENGCPANWDVHHLLPHETECNLFYYCVHGKLVQRECPPKTHFNPTIQVCDWPENAGCSSGNGGDSSESSSSHSHESSGSHSHEDSDSHSHESSGSHSHESSDSRSHENSGSHSHESSGSHSHENSGSLSHESSGGDSHESSDSHSHENSGSHSHESSGSHSHENSGSHSHENPGSHSHESSDSHSHENSGSHSHENSGSHSHESSGSHSHESSDSHSHENSGSHSHESSGSQSHESSGRHSHESSGSHSHENSGSHSHESSDSHSHENSGSDSHESSASNSREWLENGCPADWDIHHLLPHKTRCNRFYYCVHGNKVERECPPGLHYNKEIQVCDWPQNAGCTNAGGSDSSSSENSDSSSSENSGNGSNEWLENGCPADWDVHHLLPHESECNLFYYCVHGKLVQRECPPETHFNPSIQACDWPQNAGCANGGASSESSDSSSSESSDSSSSESSDSSSSESSGNNSDNSENNSNENSGSNNSENSGSNSSENSGNNSNEGSGSGEIEIPVSPEDLICQNTCNGGHWSHSTDCDKFWRCDNGKAVLGVCAEGLHFNEQTHTCDFICNANCERTRVQATVGKAGLKLFVPWDKVDNSLLNTYKILAA